MTRLLSCVVVLALASVALAAAAGNGRGRGDPATTRNVLPEYNGSTGAYIITGASIRFYSSNFRDVDMAILDTHPEITSVVFSESLVLADRMPGGGSADFGSVEFNTTDEGFAHIANLKNLESLTLDTRYPMRHLTDEALSALKGLKLKSLSLGTTKFTAKGLDAIAGMESLTRLDASGCPPGEVIGAASKCPNLRALSLGTVSFGMTIKDSDRPKEEDFAPLANLKALEEFRMGTLASDDYAPTLAKLTTLKVLQLQGTNVTDVGMAKLAPLSKLEELNLDNAQISDASMAIIGGFQNLKTLVISHTNITDAGMLSLPKMPNLEVLNIQFDRSITDKGFAAMDRFPKLETLQASISAVKNPQLLGLRKTLTRRGG